MKIIDNLKSVNDTISYGNYEKKNKYLDILIEHAPDGDQMYFCRLHDYLLSENDNIHCAIFCNLSDDFIELTEIFEILENFNYEKTSLKILLYNLNSIIDKIVLIDEFLKLETSKDELFIIRRWTNFFKHAKSFLYVHHPHYISNEVDLGNYDIVIDNNFIDKYYKIDKVNINNELKLELENKTRIAVILPNSLILFENFCKTIKQIVLELKNDKDKIEKLKFSTLYLK